MREVIHSIEFTALEVILFGNDNGSGVIWRDSDSCQIVRSSCSTVSTVGGIGGREVNRSGLAQIVTTGVEFSDQRVESL